MAHPRFEVSDPNFHLIRVFSSASAPTAKAGGAFAFQSSPNIGKVGDRANLVRAFLGNFWASGH